ncbi:MAG: formate/nitrite transporter family protein [Synergistaceae bacterium]|jgi:formate/nitrite transporter|nr:formate/nitrite transporter family protein [Synergistaceae bacterium]
MNLFSAPENMRNYVELGGKKAECAALKLFLLGIASGVILGFGGVAANTASHALANPSAARIVSGLMFGFCLGMIMLTGSELFTGNCMIVVSVAARRTTLAGMLRNWFYVYAGNMTGGLILACGIVASGQLDYNGGALALHTIRTAAAKCAIPFARAVLLGVFCNILVCMGVLCSLTARDAFGRIAGAYLPVTFFVIGGFEHSIANMYYIPAGLFAAGIEAYSQMAGDAGLALGALSWGSFFARNLLPVTIGNIIGGAGTGLLFWFCHAREDKGTGPAG